MSRHILLCLGLIYSLNCYSQSNESRLVNKYVQQDGLSSYNIRSIVQDPMGFIWIATQEGLNLFDGRNFTKYTHNSNGNNKILASDVRSLTIDTTRHVIWVLTSIGGINAIDYLSGKVVRSIEGGQVDNDDWNISMVLCQEKLWIGCMTSLKVYDLHKNQWIKGPEIPFERNSNDELFGVKNIFLDAKGNIWAFLNHYGILLIDPATRRVKAKLGLQRIFSQSSENDLNFTAVAELSPGNLIVGTSAGIKLISDSGQTIVARDPEGTLSRLGKIGAIALSRDNIYVANNLHLYKFQRDLKNYTKLSEAKSSSSESWFTNIQNMHIDDEGNGWIGCKQGLAFLSNKKAAFKSVSNKSYKQSGLTHVYNVFPIEASEILVSQENGLLTYNSLNEQFHSIDNKRAFYYAFRDFDGNMIVTGDQGMFLLKNYKLTSLASLYPELKPITNCCINSHLLIGDSLCVMGSDNNRGVFVWNYKKKSLRIIDNNSKPVKLRSNIVNRVYRDSSGQIWVLSDNGIDILSPDFSNVGNLHLKMPVSGEPIKLFFDICQSMDCFWIACYSFGILQVNKNGKVLKVINSSDGLCNDGVYKIFNKRDKKLIITSNNGLSVMSMDDLTFTNYYERDGLHSDAFEEACGIEVNGKIFAGGLNGFTIIDPDLLTNNNISPKLYFNTIKIDTKNGLINVRDLKLQDLIVPYDALQTTISFTGLNYNNPGRVRFRYKIEEINSKWINIGARSFINIIGISPGDYNLFVQVANEDGIWNRLPLKLRLHFLPHWYQTWWFKLLSVMIVFGFFYWIYSYRINQLKVQHAIRRDIANDLHDDLGSSLNSIKMFTHLALHKKDNKVYVNEIDSLITNATAGLRDMLWVLEDSKDRLSELMERIKKISWTVAEASGIEFFCSVDPEIRGWHISKTEKRNLLLIAKEAINNCLKYSSCSSIKVYLCSSSSKRIVLSITDDGRGFDINTVKEGYGLGNIRYRAEQISYNMRVISEVGKGTTIIVEG
ncbi:ligand-binding sensor domain-containing protein [Mucilaginibacter pocheonensis]|uniref:Ligand-binding sensor domain-containing protein n=1 Tax=Mucilaginibacter pocheonensis TaxID=398050 RepID=A0ABU1T8L6_9SPHI|nr:triple tyrosine motif-containing protein [Mucilaginibacter pocheonensis]MDR6941687.1 ligand-binding sensor domain-containing protein [Mucilaginibacter pocheonensis]